MFFCKMNSPAFVGMIFSLAQVTNETTEILPDERDLRVGKHDREGSTANQQMRLLARKT